MVWSRPSSSSQWKFVQRFIICHLFLVIAYKLLPTVLRSYRLHSALWWFADYAVKWSELFPWFVWTLTKVQSALLLISTLVLCKIDWANYCVLYVNRLETARRIESLTGSLGMYEKRIMRMWVSPEERLTLHSVMNFDLLFPGNAVWRICRESWKPFQPCRPHCLTLTAFTR